MGGGTKSGLEAFLGGVGEVAVAVGPCSTPCSPTLHVLQNAYKRMTSRHPLIKNQQQVAFICLFA